MPKGKPKKKREKLSAPPDSASPDEDSESICSSLDGCSVVSEEAVPDEEVEEDLEFRLAELIDQLAEKSLRTRLEAASALSKILSAKIVVEQLMGRRETLLEVITRGLRKASGRERCELAKLAILMVLQLGMECPEIQRTLQPQATQLAQDTTILPADRAEAIRMLALVTFVQASDILEVEHVMRTFEGLFEKCKEEAVVTAAVQSWTLLLSIAPDHSIPALFTSMLPVLNKLLERVELSVRLSVGMGMALLFELTRESCSEAEEMMESVESSSAYSLIEQLATESNRHTSRKDRNQTRSRFRDILLSLDDGSVPEKIVKVGIEELSLDSWAKLCQYTALREILGSGINSHLKQNDLLRDIFLMGPAPISTTHTKSSRLEQKYIHAAVAKHRTQSRGKQRDKRAVL